ncbi:SRPBCC domain-containing protein [Humibacter sp. RRB41]|uniref:SRPBCC family protein n=1 Tax=Humibacter sp. RRB41 TaxID=2919946 RepID=UPI001FAAF2CA|nr:SRPBCC domain-containing protein [Humibacter sp. RRB41]
MVDIIHRVGARPSSRDAAYAALTTLDGLSGWWTRDTTGEPDRVGGVVAFRFLQGGFDMKVLELLPGERVLWEVVDGPAEWMGTTVAFDLHDSEDFTIVLFAHRGWREEVEFMNHCSTKWATFLVSLKQLLETGVGAPAPDDLQISDWH